MSAEPVAQEATTIEHFADIGETITRHHVSYPAAIQWARRTSKISGVDTIEVRLDGDLREVYIRGRVALRRGAR